MTLHEHWNNYRVGLYMSLPKMPVNEKQKKLRDKKQIINTLMLLVILLICLVMSIVVEESVTPQYIFIGFIVGDLLYLLKLLKKYL